MIAPKSLNNVDNFRVGNCSEYDVKGSKPSDLPLFHDKTKVERGPEFVRGSHLPSIHLCFPTTKVLLPHWRTITVLCVNGQRYEIDCDIFAISVNDIFSLIIQHQHLKERFLFGLAILQDGLYKFVELENKLCKVMPNKGKCSHHNEFTLHLRIKFYVEASSLRYSDTMHSLYLQLRQDVIADRISCNFTTGMLLASFALQNEYGDFDDEIIAVFPVEYYVPVWIMENLSVVDIRSQLKSLHMSHQGMSSKSSEEHFICAVQTQEEYGYHFHPVFRDKKKPNSMVLLGISVQGIGIFDANDIPGECKLKIQRHLWGNVIRISYTKTYFCIILQHQNLRRSIHKYKYYTSKNMGLYLFNLASSHHRLHLRFIFNICHENPHRNQLNGINKSPQKSASHFSRKSTFKLFNNSKKASSLPLSSSVENKNSKAITVSGEDKLCLESSLSNGNLKEDNSGQKSENERHIDKNPPRNIFIIETSINSKFGSPFVNLDESVNSSLAERFANMTGIEQSTERRFTSVSLKKDDNNCLGMMVCEGTDGCTYIQSRKEQLSTLNIQQGDRIVAINGIYVENFPHEDVVDLIHDAVGTVNLTLSQAVRSTDAFMSNKLDKCDNLKDIPRNSRIFIGKKSIIRSKNSTQNVKSNNSAELTTCPPNPSTVSYRHPLKPDDFRDQGQIMSTNIASNTVENHRDLHFRKRYAVEICRSLSRSTELVGDGDLFVTQIHSNVDGNGANFNKGRLSKSIGNVNNLLLTKSSSHFNHFYDSTENVVGLSLMGDYELNDQRDVKMECLPIYTSIIKDQITSGDSTVSLGGVNNPGACQCNAIGLVGGGRSQNCAVDVICSLDESVEDDAFTSCRLSAPHSFYNLVSIKKSASTPNSSPSDAMVSKLNESTEREATSYDRDSEEASSFDISGQSPTETEKSAAARYVLWQPKMSGSVKNRIRNIEAHSQTPERHQHLQEGVLSKSPVSCSSQDLCHYQSVPKWKNSSSTCDSPQSPVKSVDGGDLQEKLTQDGTWCSAVVSKPYRPGRSLAVNLARSKTLPSVYQEVTRNESTDNLKSSLSSSIERSNLVDDMPPLPPPWLQDLKRRSSSGQQARPPWWSRAYSIDEGRLSSLPAALVPRSNQESPLSGKTGPVRTNSPLVNKKLLPSDENISSPSNSQPSPVTLRKTPSSLSPVLRRKTNGHIQDNLIDSYKSDSSNSFVEISSVSQKICRSETTSLKSVSTLNSEKGSSTPAWSFLLENMRQKYSFVNKDNVFKVSLTKNSRGLGISICGGSDQIYDYSCKGDFVRIKRLYPLQPALESGKLNVGDIILAVNGTLLRGFKQNEAVDILRICPATVELLICRTPSGVLPPVPQNDDLAKSCILSMSSHNLLGENAISHPQSSEKEFEINISKVNGSLGFTLHKKDNHHRGHFIKALVKEPAITDGRLQPGDELLKVNSVDIAPMTHEEAINFLRLAPTEVCLVIGRQSDLLPSPLSPLCPVIPDLNQEYLTTKQDKKILRKEALDLVTDSYRKRNGESGSNSYESTIDRRNRRNRSNEDSGSFLNETQSGISDVESQRNTPTLPKSNCSSPTSWKSNLTNSASDLSRESSTSSVPSRTSNSFLKTQTRRPTSLDLQSGSAKEGQAPKTSPQISALKPVPSLRVSKWESDGTPSTDEADSDSSGAFNRYKTIHQERETVLHTVQTLSSRSKSPKRPMSLPLRDNSDFRDSKYGLAKWRGTDLDDAPRSKSFSGERNLQVFTVELDRQKNSRLGFSLVNVEIGKLKGSFIREIHSGSLASQDGSLNPGDRVLKVNNISTANKTTSEVIEILRNLKGKIILEVMRNQIITNAVLTLLKLQLDP